MIKLKFRNLNTHLLFNNKSDYCYFKTRNYLPE